MPQRASIVRRGNSRRTIGKAPHRRWDLCSFFLALARLASVLICFQSLGKCRFRPSDRPRGGRFRRRGRRLIG
jgi:hypothetical protein